MGELKPEPNDENELRELSRDDLENRLAIRELMLEKIENATGIKICDRCSGSGAVLHGGNGGWWASCFACRGKGIVKACKKCKGQGGFKSYASLITGTVVNCDACEGIGSKPAAYDF